MTPSCAPCGAGGKPVNCGVIGGATSGLRPALGPTGAPAPKGLGDLLALVRPALHRFSNAGGCHFCVFAADTAAVAAAKSTMRTLPLAAKPVAASMATPALASPAPAPAEQGPFATPAAAPASAPAPAAAPSAATRAPVSAEWCKFELVRGAPALARGGGGPQHLSRAHAFTATHPPRRPLPPPLHRLSSTAWSCTAPLVAPCR